MQARLTMATPFSLSAAFRSLSIATPKRAFSTTLATQSNKTLPEHIPAYPHGPRQWYKQADTGLYGGAMIRFGNKISDGRNEGKTRRSWKPNVRRKKLWSDALGEHLFIKVTRRALRTIQKEGGLDKYLISDRPARIRELGVFGWELRWKVMQSPAMQEKFQKQRQQLGLPDHPSFEEWMKGKEDEVEARIQERLSIKSITKPRAKGLGDPQRLAMLAGSDPRNNASENVQPEESTGGPMEDYETQPQEERADSISR
ncbi:54S ribosomal protein L24 [Penicillium capsulatum]|uniref:Large ribosomal subunit protein bL28m n=1 Tax=Penicillium capsulatum TaxID=69766 RepID=A0A9W9IIK9_9EURO|nr:54S ribosomal protein L24 [Penicillium capsulatum]KAJ6122411.1 54S ribosomal protein L24 [Penicillium capsulatum]